MENVKSNWSIDVAHGPFCAHNYIYVCLPRFVDHLVSLLMWKEHPTHSILYLVRRVTRAFFSNGSSVLFLCDIVVFMLIQLWIDYYAALINHHTQTHYLLLLLLLQRFFDDDCVWVTSPFWLTQSIGTVRNLIYSNLIEIVAASVSIWRTICA